MEYLRKYPTEYLDALLSIEEAKKLQQTNKQKSEGLFGRKAIWSYLSKIKLHDPLIKLYLEQSIKPDSTPTLKNFLRDNHNGSVNDAIDNINRIANEISFFVDVTKKWEQLEYIQLVGDFLHEVNYIIPQRKNSEIKSGKYYYKSDIPHLLNQNKNFLNPITNLKNHYKGHPQFSTIKLPKKVKGARTPSAYMPEFCIICPNLSSINSYYCYKHTSSKGNKSEIKKTRRVFENAFKNLDLISSYDADENISNRDPEIFIEKCYKLEGWAKHRPEQKKFEYELDNIASKYFLLFEATDWPNNTVKMLNEIVQLTNRHKHISDIFNFYFSSNDAISEVIKKLQNDVFQSDKKEILLYPSTAIEIISRMSKFRLIKLASHNKIA